MKVKGVLVSLTGQLVYWEVVYTSTQIAFMAEYTIRTILCFG